MSDAHGVPLDVDALEGWLTDRVEVTPPLTASQISGGRSNLTYRVADADGRTFVVRRPPLGDLLPGAHDMSREARVMSALADSAVPVPEVIGYEGDESIIGGTFYVMRHVDGLILRTTEDGASIDESARATATRSLASTMAELHRIDPYEIGLVKPGRGDNYLARQLHVWKRQMDAQKGRELPVADAVHDRLTAAIPEQPATAIVHGDYRLDNVILDPDGTVAAVLDWELWTAGDPLADLAITLVYWGDDSVPDALIGRPTGHPGYGTGADFVRAYLDAGGIDVPDDVLPYYMAFATWRLAAILEGVYQRNRAGAYGDADDGWRMFEEKVTDLFDMASGYADEAGI